MGARAKETPLHHHHHHLNEVKLETESTLFLPLEEVEKIVGYEFKNKTLLEEAFTHSTYGREFSYERLEFLGDAVLRLVFTWEHYLLYPDLAPGKLTCLRSANVDNEKLARVALEHGLHRYLRHKKPLLEHQIQEFSKAVLEYPVHSNGLIDAPKALADLVESTSGAIFMDNCHSIDIVWKVLKPLLEPIITPETLQVHPKTEIHELCQKTNMRLNYVDSWKKSFVVDCYVNDQLVGSGIGLRKEVAKNRASKDALENKWKWMPLEQEEQEKEASTVVSLCGLGGFKNLLCGLGGFKKFFDSW